MDSLKNASELQDLREALQKRVDEKTCSVCGNTGLGRHRRTLEPFVCDCGASSPQLTRFLASKPERGDGRPWFARLSKPGLEALAGVRAKISREAAQIGTAKPRSIYVYGPTGAGKTAIAQCWAYQLYPLPTFWIDYRQMLDAAAEEDLKLVGSRDANGRIIKKTQWENILSACKVSPCIIIDELFIREAQKTIRADRHHSVKAHSNVGRWIEMLYERRLSGDSFLFIGTAPDSLERLNREGLVPDYVCRRVVEIVGGPQRIVGLK